VDVTVEFLPATGSPIQKVYRIDEGPGQRHLRVLTEVGAINDHATIITARTPAGALSNITVERTLWWAYGDRRESSSAMGAPAPALFWYFAEGGKGGSWGSRRTCRS
jgi:hypothetical protein